MKTANDSTPSAEKVDTVEIRERSLNYQSAYRGTAADPKARATFKDHHEANFIAEKREQGFTDNQIAKMLGRTVQFIQMPEVVDHSSPNAPRVVDEVTFTVERRVKIISADERKRRDQAARKFTTWRADERK